MSPADAVIDDRKQVFTSAGLIVVAGGVRLQEDNYVTLHLKQLNGCVNET
jgi:hypothetical protein